MIEYGPLVKEQITFKYDLNPGILHIWCFLIVPANSSSNLGNAALSLVGRSLCCIRLLKQNQTISIQLLNVLLGFKNFQPHCPEENIFFLSHRKKYLKAKESQSHAYINYFETCKKGMFLKLLYFLVCYLLLVQLCLESSGVLLRPPLLSRRAKSL